MANDSVEGLSAEEGHSKSNLTICNSANGKLPTYQTPETVSSFEQNSILCTTTILLG